MATRKKKKKNRIGVKLGVLLVLILLAAGVIYIVVNKIDVKEMLTSTGDKLGLQETEDPEEVLANYIELINQKDYEQMYELLSTQSKDNISKDDFITKNKNIYEGIGSQNLNIKVSDVSELELKKKTITYDFTMDTLAGEIASSNTMTWCLEDGGKYRLEWQPSVIYPTLTASDKIRVFETVGQRGELKDRNGNVLAGIGSKTSVGIVPGELGENKKEALNAIAAIIGLSRGEIEGKLSALWVKDDLFVPIITYDNDDPKIDQLRDLAGISMTETKTRVYPYGEVTAHLIGYVQKINEEELEENKDKGYDANSIIGKTGLEYLYEDRLRGKSGYEIAIVGSDGAKKKVLAQKEAIKGEDIQLTIDIELQNKIYQEFKEDQGVSVAMNPETGEILAMVSYTSYDPNNFVSGLSEEQWHSLNNNPTQPLYNRYRASFSPGSSFKPLIAAGALTSGKLDADENFGASGLSWQKDSSWGSYKITTLVDYGNQAVLRNALIYSDNIYFAKLALKLGETELKKEMESMGFSEKVNFDIDVPASTISSTGEFSSEINLADSGYGQGEVLVNPVHMAVMYSAFSNNGSMVQPYLEYKQGVTPSYWKENVFSKEAVDTVTEGMIQVIENAGGSGHDAKISGRLLAGKTGTAEIKTSQDDKTGTELGWFCVFDADEQKENKILMVTMVQGVKDRGGSKYLLPKVKNILNNYQ